MLLDEPACPHLAARAGAGEPVILLQALLPLLVGDVQREVALCDFLTSWQIMERSEAHLHARQIK